MNTNKSLKGPEGVPSQENKEITLSLVTVTRGRTAELHHFLESLRAQNFQSLEVILVDQTTGSELNELLEEFRIDC